MQGKDGQTNLNIIKIGIRMDGFRAPWIERIDDNLLSMESPKSKSPVEWQRLAANMKQRLLEFFHRELLFSGIINEEMSYMRVPLALVGIEI